MGRYRKILVAFDGSDHSHTALIEAVRLARMEKSWIKVVAVVPGFEGDIELTGVNDINEAISGPGERLLNDARRIAKEQGATILTDLEQGEAYERIVDVASEENCDIILMGRRGAGGFGQAVLGSVTARVIGYTDKDVLVVSNDANIKFKKILLPTDGSKYSRNAAKRALDIAASYGGSIEAVSVVDFNEEFQTIAPDAYERQMDMARGVLNDIKRACDEKGITCSPHLKEGETAAVITNSAKDIKADVIVMGSHGRTGLRRLLMGSTTEKVIGNADCPVLVVGA